MYFDPVSAGLSLATSVIGFAQQKAEARRRNEQLRRQYKLQIAQYKQQNQAKVGEYNLRKVRSAETISNINKQAQAAAAQEQLRMNEMFRASKFADEAAGIERTKQLGKRAARGVSGKSAARGAALDMADYGRKQSMKAQNLFSQQAASELRTQAREQEAAAAKKSAWFDVAFGPTFGPAPQAPMQDSGPGALSLLGGAVSAFGAGYAGGQANKALKMRNPGS